jgi:DnaJ-class molecular chaperone
MNQPEREPCPGCFGTGKMRLTQSPYPMGKATPTFCWECDGTGFRRKPPAESSPSDRAA